MLQVVIPTDSPYNRTLPFGPTPVQEELFSIKFTPQAARVSFPIFRVVSKLHHVTCTCFICVAHVQVGSDAVVQHKTLYCAVGNVVRDAKQDETSGEENWRQLANLICRICPKNPPIIYCPNVLDSKATKMSLYSFCTLMSSILKTDFVCSEIKNRLEVVET